MSYLNRIYSFGFQKFASEMTDLKIRHLIIPDLPVTSLTAGRLTRPGLQLVPVLAANISDARLEKLLAAGFDFFYLMSDFKITGSTFSGTLSGAGIGSQLYTPALPLAQIGERARAFAAASAAAH